MEIKIKRLSEDAILPKKATNGAVGYDLYVPKDTLIPACERVLIPLDIAIQLPHGFEFKIESRSGFAVKGIEGNNGHRYDAQVLTGKIDSDYTGNVCVIIKSFDKENFTIPKGTRIAQGSIYYTHPEMEFVEVDELDETERGNGGFGSTGTK